MGKSTFGQIKEVVWKNLGEPDDLTPYYNSETPGVNRVGATLASDSLLGLYVNKAQLAVSTWSDPVSSRKYRWKGSKKNYFLYGELETGTVVSGSEWIIQVSSDMSVEVGDAIEVNDEIRYVMDVVGQEITLAEDLSSAPSAGDVVTRYPTYLTISDVDILEVLKVEDLTNSTTLERFDKSETDLFSLDDPGEPTKWDKRGDRLYFDKPIDGRYRFRLFVYKQPVDMSNDSQYSELPNQVEYGIILKSMQYGFLHMNEEMSASYAYNDFNKFMRTTQDEWDMDGIMDDGAGSSVELV